MHSNQLMAAFLVLGFVFGCSEDKGIVPIEEPIKRNHDPVMIQQADTFAIVGDTLRLQFIASDQDGDSLNFRQDVLCTWGEIKDGKIPYAYIDTRDGSFWFYPHAYDAPERQVTVTVGDGHGGYGSTTFVVLVSTGF